MTLNISNTVRGYGLVSIILHWVMAGAVFGMFALGIYMRGLDYVHPWYTKGPLLHESFGLVVFTLLVFRVLWRVFNPRPEMPDIPDWERKTALLVHRLFYVFLFGIVISGYLIPTADGRAVPFFNLFEVPAIISGIDGQEDVAGLIHYRLAVATIALSVLHALAAFKHHFIDRDATLLRMLGVNSKPRR